MQACPCARLRLWQRYGRDWPARRPPGIPRLARTLGTAAGRRLDRPPELTTETFFSVENEPNRHQASTTTKTKTTKTTKTITKRAKAVARRPEDGKVPPASAPPPPPPPPPPHQRPTDWRFFMPSAPGRATDVHPVQLFSSHVRYIEKTAPADQVPAAVAEFLQWKAAMADTWCMLEDGLLPAPLPPDDASMLGAVLQAEQAAQAAEWDTQWFTSPVDDVPVDDLNDAVDARARIRSLWTPLTAEQRAWHWPRLLVAALRSAPELVPDVFAATFDGTVAPVYVAEDLVTFLLRARSLPDTQAANAHALTAMPYAGLVEMVRLGLEGPNVANALRLRQHTLYLLVQAAPTAADVEALYGLLRATGHPLNVNTLLHMGYRLAQSVSHKTAAVDIVRMLTERVDFDVNDAKGSALCTAILSAGWEATTQAGSLFTQPDSDQIDSDQIDTESETNRPTPALLFEQLLHCGLEPNVITYTAIIRELCNKGEVASAQEVVAIMLTSHVGLDPYVYSILMNGAKLAHNAPMVCQVAEAAAAHRIHHPYVWNDFLQAIHLLAVVEARTDPEYTRPRIIPAFPLMLDAYRRTFVFDPLVALLPFVARLGPASSSSADDSSAHGVGINPTAAWRRHWTFVDHFEPAVRALPQLAAAHALRPTGVTLSSMVMGYIKGLSNPYDVIEFYSHFQRLLRHGDPVAAMVVQQTGSLVYDIVVLALCEYDGMLRVALDVVSNMLRDAADGLKDPEPQHGNPRRRYPLHKKIWDPAEPLEKRTRLGGMDPIVTPESTGAGTGLHPPPSVYTWSILLNGFLFHRHAAQAEGILKMMHKRGITPNEVTWNTLVAGYARLQMPHKTGQALLRREAAGFAPDDFTFRAFSYLGDKAAVIQYLERHRHQATRRHPHRQNHPEIARSLRVLARDFDVVTATVDAKEGLKRQQQGRGTHFEQVPYPYVVT